MPTIRELAQTCGCCDTPCGYRDCWVDLGPIEYAFSWSVKSTTKRRIWNQVEDICEVIEDPPYEDSASGGYTSVSAHEAEPGQRSYDIRWRGDFGSCCTMPEITVYSGQPVAFWNPSNTAFCLGIGIHLPRPDGVQPPPGGWVQGNHVCYPPERFCGPLSGLGWPGFDVSESYSYEEEGDLWEYGPCAGSPQWERTTTVSVQASVSLSGRIELVCPYTGGGGGHHHHHGGGGGGGHHHHGH